MNMKIRGVGAFIAGFLLFHTSVYADQIASKSEISSVTVYPSGAQITRTFPVELKPGKHTIILDDLPWSMLANSVIVNAPKDSGIRIDSIDTKNVPVSEERQKQDLARKQLQDQVDALENEKANLGLDLKTTAVQQEYISKLAGMPAGNSMQNEPDWANVYSLISEKSAEINRKNLETETKIRELVKQITELNRKLGILPPLLTYQNELKINLVADKEIKTSLSMHYQVNSAGWSQQYEAHLSTKGGIDEAALKIVRRASISQRTGESWKDVKLVLSTTSPTQGTSEPNLDPLRLVLRYAGKGEGYSNNVQYEQQQKMQSYGGNIVRQSRSNDVDTAESEEQFAFHSLFHVPENISLETNGGAKQIPMGEFDVKPALRAVTVPRLKKYAYLSAKFKMPKELYSAAGETVIYRDGTYVGTGALPNLNAGAEYDLGFGVDTKIIVRRAEINRTKDRQTGILSSTQSDERHFRITVKNLHGWKMPVTVIDRFPFAHDKEISIVLYPNTTKPTRENIEDKRGVIAWDREIEAGKQDEIELAYKVTWPGDRLIDIDTGYVEEENFRRGMRKKY